MEKRNSILLSIGLILALILSACQSGASGTSGKKTIVVTYSIMGAVVKDLVGDQATVVVPMPNGQDPHEWEPSARDIETINRANLIVQNGLGLEGGMQKALSQAKEGGVKFFTASDYIPIRHVGKGEGLPTGDPDQAEGAEDPHLWMDPVDIKLVVDALATLCKSDLGIDVSVRAKDLDSRLDGLNQEVQTQVQAIPASNRKLVTGHESMGYYAQRYGFKLVGALIPSLSSQAEVSASDLAALKQQIQENQVKAIFTELGTPKAVSEAIGKETGVKVVELTTHSLPPDGSYFTFLRNLTEVIVKNLK
ncbi:MAG TPA: metal ABC transporter substrate-binding protein [Anaerolineaceae bacterium]|nr:metal ABC transporter substrate-binding protein [Anaerolineaceae bacterium]